MQAEHRPKSAMRARLNLTRRRLIQTLASGAMISISSSRLAAASRDPLGDLIAEFHRLDTAIQAHGALTSPMFDSPERPKFSATFIADVDPTSTCCDRPFWSEREVETFFAPYENTMFGGRTSREKNMQNKAALISEIKRKRMARDAWDRQHGLHEMQIQYERLVDELITVRDRIWLFPCSDFSMVVKKIMFIRNDLNGDTLDGELGTMILLSTIANDAAVIGHA